MNNKRATHWPTRALLVAALGGGMTVSASAEAVDFRSVGDGGGFAVSASVPSNFADPVWSTPSEFNGQSVPTGRVAVESVNADTTLYVGPDTLTTLGKRITGDIYFGTDDDYVGIALGVPQNPFVDPTADYLLLQWKGVDQNFDWTDRDDQGDPFHGATPGGFAPAGLSLSRVSGVPTADELWQRADLTPIDPNSGAELFDTGGVQELARANTLGQVGYNTFGQRHQFEIEFTPSNLKVFVDGRLEFDVDASAGSPFGDGTLALYEQAQSPSGGHAFWDVRDLAADPADPTPDLSIPLPSPVFGAANIDIGRNEADGTFTNEFIVAAGTTDDEGNAVVAVTSSANRGDVEMTFGGQGSLPPVGVLMATVRQNGPTDDGLGGGGQFGGVEAPAPSGFGSSAGLATFGFEEDGEFNTAVAVALFPYADGFRGGYVNPTGAVIASNDPDLYTTSQSDIPLPTIVQAAPDLDGEPAAALFFAGFQGVVTNLAISGEDSNRDGLLFTVGASNEDNVTAVAPLADGTWNAAVRDGDSPFYGGPDTAERDDFAFLYLEEGDLPGSVGGRVTAVDPQTGELTITQDWGGFELVRTGEGRFALSIDGRTDLGSQGMLLLASNDTLTLTDGTVMPANRWLTYEASGDVFEIELFEHLLVGDLSFEDVDNDGDGTPDERVFTDTQDLLPTLADGSFSFAFIPFQPGDVASLVGDLNGDGFVGAGDLDILLGVWNQDDSGVADLNGDGFIGAGDLDILLGNWNAGTAPGGSASVIPEPASLALLGLGVLGALGWRRSA